MNRYYEARARWHDEYMGFVSNDDMEQLLGPMIEIIQKEIVGKSVLEIACGTGNWTEVLAKRAASVVAIDSSPSALAIARSKLSAYDNISLLQGDAYEIGDIGNTFEVLFSADWWSHIPKRILPAFLDSSMRIILSGSKAVFLDMSIREVFEEEPYYYDDDGNRISLRVLPDGTEFRVVKNFSNEQELRSILAGYSDRIAYYDFTALKRWMVIVNLKR